MTRYKLPDVLGGGEFGAAYVHAGMAHFDIPEVGRVTVPETKIVEVPTPPEPDPGAWSIGGVLAVRWADGGDTRWAYEGQRQGYTADWDVVWTVLGGPGVTIHRLVPESSDRAQPPTVDLPWRHKDSGGDSVEIALIPTPAGEVAALVVEEGSEHSYWRAAMWLDAHAARMGAVAAILAADREIGGEE